MNGVMDPQLFLRTFWSDRWFYNKQWEVIYSVQENDETYVPAGNKLGKDYVAAFIALHFFLTRTPCKIITTSAKEKHLNVLWGEMESLIKCSKLPLIYGKGGILKFNSLDVRKFVNGERVPLTYILGMVAAEDTEAALQGHHVAETGDRIPRTLAVVDEASSVPNRYMPLLKTWANRILAIGNAWPCDNFWKHAIKGKPGTKDRGGDKPRNDEPGYYRKVIKIRAEDSPNVRYALAEITAGLKVSHKQVLPGVKSYREYKKQRENDPPNEQCVVLDAEFYEGAEVLLFPPEWLNHSHSLESVRPRPQMEKWMGCDPGEGGDDTCWSIIDRYGLLKLVSMKTPDTAEIIDITIGLMKQFDIEADHVMFDRGGGGKQAADRLRRLGYDVQTVAFGAPPTVEDESTDTPEGASERKTIYKNRRAEMYGDLREMIRPVVRNEDSLISEASIARQIVLNAIAGLAIKPRTPRTEDEWNESRMDVLPVDDYKGFCIPAQYAELRRQLAPIPLKYGEEGKMILPPKRKPSPNSKEPTLLDIIGCSPDEADSLAISVHCMLKHRPGIQMGAF